MRGAPAYCGIFGGYILAVVLRMYMMTLAKIPPRGPYQEWILGMMTLQLNRVVPCYQEVRGAAPVLEHARTEHSLVVPQEVWRKQA